MTVWFLVLLSVGGHGRAMLTIKQINSTQCEANAEEINKGWNMSAYCIQGKE